MFGCGHWEETKERQLGPLLQLFWFVGSVHLGRDYCYVMHWCKDLGTKFWLQFHPKLGFTYNNLAITFSFELDPMCGAYGWMDGWPCSSNLSQHLLTQFNHTIFLEKKWMEWARVFFFLIIFMVGGGHGGNFSQFLVGIFFSGIFSSIYLFFNCLNLEKKISGIFFLNVIFFNWEKKIQLPKPQNWK